MRFNPTDFPQLLAALTAIPGVSGEEDLIARYTADLFAQYASAVTIDALANVIAHFGAAHRQPHIAVVAHLDTVGLMVRRVNADGTLGVVPVGGVNLKALSGAALRAGEIEALVSVRSQHLAGAGDTAVNVDDLNIDTGGTALDIGTPLTYAPQTVRLGAYGYSSPYLDNRAGLAVLIALAPYVDSLPSRVTFIASAQEETTALGAYRALHTVAPDAALFVDGALAYDTPEVRGRGNVALGGGAVLPRFLYTSGLNGWHAHPRLRAHLRAAAASADIPTQDDAAHGIMSDARAAALLAIPNTLVGVPMRGKHAPLETLDLRDLAAAADLVYAALAQPLPDLSRG